MSSASQPAPSPQLRTLPVATIVAMAGKGVTAAEILQVFPELKPEDVRLALVQAAEIMSDANASLAGDDSGAQIMQQAQQNSGLSEDEAMELAVSEVRAYRDEKARRSK